MVWKPLNTEPGARDPRPISDSLPDVTKRLGLARPSVLTAVFARWDDVVGSPLRDHVRPVGLRDGALSVEVDEPAWATQLRFLEADLLSRINDATGAETVTSLVVRVRGARGRGGRPLKSLDPLDPLNALDASEGSPTGSPRQPREQPSRVRSQATIASTKRPASTASDERSSSARRNQGKAGPNTAKKTEK
jgi:hypothetical protein